MQDSDIEILNRVKKGEINLFREIVEKYKDRSFSLTLRILKNRNEAEDSLQESFLRLYKAIIAGGFEEKAKFSTYFYTIVYNTAIEHYRKYNSKNFNITSIEINDSFYKDGDELYKNYYESRIDEALIDTAEHGTERNSAIAEIKSIIEKYVSCVPEHYSVILNMFYINELSYDEISKILKIPLGTVKNRIFRAKEKLKEILLREFSARELLEYIN
ncbi:MAG: sigma-70 family RNA polymerase sigma factor [Ignavibacteriae bacterium]|nr:sigma-70 family RNA polymerase sigma factor [Ignavibacteriota bacterium]